MTPRSEVASLHGFADYPARAPSVRAQDAPGGTRKPPLFDISQASHVDEELAMSAANAVVSVGRKITLRGCLIVLATLLLAALAVAMGIVSWHGQFGFIFDIKHQRLAAALEALGPDCGAVIFAILGVALALLGRRAIAERILVCACAALSILMNLGSANLGSPRAIGAYIMPPVLFAITSDRLIAVIRRSALGTLKGDAERSPWQFAGVAVLYGLRLIVAPPSTITGLRRALLDATPLPDRPEPDAKALPPAEARRAITATASSPRPVRKPRRARGTKGNGTKTQRLIDLVTERHGALADFPLTDVSKVATATAAEIGMHPGSARTALKAAVVAAQNGGEQ
jgi:hypothetical protein